MKTVLDIAFRGEHALIATTEGSLRSPEMGRLAILPSRALPMW